MPAAIGSTLVAASAGAQSLVAAYVGSTRVYGVAPSGSLNAWGLQWFSDNTIAETAYPGLVGSETWSSVAVSLTSPYVCAAIRSDGTLWVRGDARVQSGAQLLFADTWAQNGQSNGWKSVAAGDGRFLLIREDGTLWGLGNNSPPSALGLGPESGTHVGTPTQVGSSSWRSVSMRVDHALGIRDDGTLWTWGSGPSGTTIQGVLGIGSENTSSVPLQIPGQWISASTSGIHSVAVRSDGTLWGWGWNASGAAGYLPPASDPLVLSPQQIGTASNWLYVSAGADFSLGIRSDGSLWSWGIDSDGQLGLGGNAPAQYSAPNLVSAGPWASAAAGDDHSLAIKADGSLWAWGGNNRLQLGVATAQNASANAPTHVNAGPWVACAAGLDTSLAVRTSP